MKIRKFTASTPRAALRLARAALGEDAVILSNRNVVGGVELMALAGPDMEELLDPAFAKPVAIKPSILPMASVQRAGSAFVTDLVTDSVNETSLELDGLKNEMRSMRGLLETQLASITWSGRQTEACARALRDMLAAGFSAGLTRYIAEKMPTAARASVAEGRDWMRGTLARNINVPVNEDLLLEQGGVFALVGPTGVGKTTSTAKLAARCVARHGAHKLALVTTDSYRIGAFEQLRIYGKILGVMVHAVRDEADLALALNELGHKHIVLIDTAGASQRDKMVAEQIAMLSTAGKKVQRLLCLNATATAETLDEVVRAYRGDGLAGCLLTKLDEATTIGGALDVIIRHKLTLSYIADGQRVPEDLHFALRAPLIERAFAPPSQIGIFGLTDEELPLIAANTVSAMHDPLLREVSLG